MSPRKNVRIIRHKEPTIKKQEKANIKKLEQEMKKGINLINQKRFEAALLIFQALAEKEIIRESPRSMTSVLINLGILYFQLQNHQESIDAFLTVLKIDKIYPIPKEAKEKTKLGIALSVILKLAFASKEEQALKLCEFRMKKNPENILLIEMKASLLRGLKRYEESILCFDEFLERTGKEINKDQILYKIGLNYLDLKELDTAQSYFQKGADTNPQNHLNFLGLGQVAWEKKEWLEVINHLKKAERLAPKEVDFLLNTIQCYCYCGLPHQAIPKIQKIIKSNNRIIIAQLLNWLLIEEAKDMEIKGHLLKETIQNGQKSQALLEELQNVLRANGSYPYLSKILTEIKEEAKNKPKKNQVLISSLEEIESSIKRRHELIEKYFSLVGWLIPKEEIAKCLTKETEDALETVFIKRMAAKYEIPQEEWIRFTSDIKKEKGEVFYSLKGVADFLDRLKGMKNTEAVFDSCQKGGMTIEEKINKLVFVIYPDFPGNLKTEELIIVLNFYNKRANLWEELVDLIMKGKVIPPSWATVQQWAEKTIEKSHINKTFLEKLQEEGNNLKMDMILKKREPKIYQRGYPIVSSLLKNQSEVLTARFNQRDGGNYSSLAVDYFKYIRREMKVK